MIKVNATKNTYNSKETLKLAGFVWVAAEKCFTKDFDSLDEFEAWKASKFINTTYNGRKGARINSAVVFEII